MKQITQFRRKLWQGLLTLLLLILIGPNSWGQADNWTVQTSAVTAEEETSIVNEGTSSMMVTWTSKSNQDIDSDVFSVTEGSTYSYKLDVLDNTNAGRVRMVLFFGSTSVYSSIYSVDNVSWQTLEITGTVPAGATTAYIKLRFYDESTGWAGNGNQATVYVDNAIFTLDGGSNLVANGSFDSWPAFPSITLSASSFTGLDYAEGAGPSASQSFTVEGTNLTDDISVTPSTNYEISTDDNTFQSTAITLTQSGGDVATTTIYTRLKSGLAVATYIEDITCASTGASDKTVACEGTVAAPGLTLVTPNGGEAWKQGDTETITWTSVLSGNPANVKIEVAADGTNYTTLEASTENDGTYDWVIPADQTIATTYMIRISDAADGSPSDESDAAFGIDVPPPAPEIFITEVTDPKDDYTGRFIELYNYGSTSIDLATFNVYLVKQINGGGFVSAAVTGTIDPGHLFVIAGYDAEFNALYGFDENLLDANVSGNGDDGYFIYYDGDETTGRLLDAYGVLGEDGTGKEWEYLDARAVRNPGVKGPNPIWTASEWTITSANVADMSPGVHFVDITAPVVSFAPTDGASQVSETVSPFLTFDEAILNAADGSAIVDADLASKLEFYETATPANVVAFTASITDKVITLVPDANLLLGTEYTINVLANRIEDVYGNENDLASASFTVRPASTDATISSTNYTVDNDASTISNVAFSTTLATFKSNITPADGASFEVYEADGANLATDLADGYKLICTAEDQITIKTYTIQKNAFVNNETDVLTFVLTEQNTDASIDATAHTIAIEVPYATDRSALVATFTLSAGASAEVGTTPQVSGTTPNDFSAAVVYTIIAEDGTTKQDWTVTVSLAAASTEAYVSSTVYTVDNTLSTITDVPFETSLATFKSNLSAAPLATFEVYEDDGSTLAADLASGYKVIATAEDASTTKTYVVTVNDPDPEVEITYPTGGETFYAGDEATVTWNAISITQVKIEVYVPSEDAWTTLVEATDATDGAETLTVGADATYGATYKIRISDVDNTEVADTSEAFEIIPVATTLASLRDQGVGAKVKFTGNATVTMVQSYRNQKFIQDVTAAVLIDDSNGAITSTYEIGNNITNLEGSLTEYGDLLEFVPSADPGATSGAGAVIEAQLISLDEFLTHFEEYESELIAFENVVFNAGDGSAVFETGTSYEVANATDTANFYTNFYDADYISQTIPSTTGNITGVAFSRTTGNYFAARDAADIEFAAPTFSVTFNVTDEDGSAVADAVVTFNGSSQNTDAEGKTIFTGIEAVDQAPFSISKDGGVYETYNGTVTVTNADVSVDVRMLFVGIAEVNSLVNNLYPNPTNGNITLILNRMDAVTQFTITDINGKVVMQQNITELESSIDVSGLEQGYYFVQIISGTTNYTTRMVRN